MGSDLYGLDSAAWDRGASERDKGLAYDQNMFNNRLGMFNNLAADEQRQYGNDLTAAQFNRGERDYQYGLSRDAQNDAIVADYFAMLAELGFLSDDEEKSQGDLPTEIVDAIRELKLDTTHLKASLRGRLETAAREGPDAITFVDVGEPMPGVDRKSVV